MDVAQVRQLRRLAYLVSGSREAGDEMLVLALRDKSATGLDDVLKNLFRTARKAQHMPPCTSLDPGLSALHCLPVINRAVLILMSVDGKSAAQTAGILNLPEATIDDLHATARREFAIWTAAENGDRSAVCRSLIPAL